MQSIQKAFTLIELLVVIAIIAILASILFPVFAQAKTAAKIADSISNMQQIGLGEQMYLNDSDDTFAPNRVNVTDVNGNLLGQYSWKQLIYPYVKNVGVFRDLVNPASKYPDDTSDPQFRASLGQVAEQPYMPRGYFFYQAFFLTGNWSGFGYNMNELQEPANSLLISESKSEYVDYGPWIAYLPNGEAELDGINLGLKPNWGGNKWNDQAFVVVFADSHAKRTPMQATCGQNNEINMWGYERDKLANGYSVGGGIANLTWLDTFCQSLPF